VDLPWSDAEAMLGFIADAAELDLPELYSTELLTGLQGLVRSTWVAYQDIDHDAKEFVDFNGVGPDEGEPGPEVYLLLGPCPTQEHRARTGDLAAVRNSDLIDVRGWHQLPLYRDYFRPANVEYILDLGLSAGADRIRSLVFMRASGEKDFSERDRAVVELLTPHLRNLERTAHLRELVRRSVCHAQRYQRESATGEDVGLGFSALTRREHEIVELVASGSTNAEIATALWVSPSTVKKHLEHIYAKLGVRRRAAVVAAHYAPAPLAGADWSEPGA